MEKLVLKDKTEIAINGGTTENQFSTSFPKAVENLSQNYVELVLKSLYIKDFNELGRLLKNN